MRIALLGSRGYPSTYGGFETFIRELVPRALEADHEVLVYCREGPSGEREWSVGGARCVRTRGIDDYRLSTLSYGLTSSWDVRGRDVDAALVLNPANGFWLPLIRGAGVPTVLNVDGVEWERRKWSRLGRTVFKAGAARSARHASCLVADSRAIAAIWERRFGVRPRYIPYGAEVYEDDADDELAALGVRPGEYTLTVARIVPENNVSMVLEALGLLGERERAPHVIVGSGSGSRLEREIRAAVADRSDVLHLGHVSNQRLLAQLFRHCRVYVHGHSVGGTNPALLQALGAGAPVLAYDCVFNREVIGGETDVYFADAGELCEQLRTLFASPSRRDELAAHGPERVRSAYRWSDVCRRYLRLLAELAGEEASRPATESVRT